MPPLDPRTDFEDDGYSFRVRRIQQLDRLAEAAAFRNRRDMRFVRAMLGPVWIAGTIFLGVLLFVAAYAIVVALFNW